MDLNQVKLSKSEWESIEIPVSSQEKEVLDLITKGYSDVNIRINKTDSLFTFLKIEFSSEIEDFLYNKYFAEKVKEIVKKYGLSFIKFEKARSNVRTKAMHLKKQETNEEKEGKETNEEKEGKEGKGTNEEKCLRDIAIRKGGGVWRVGDFSWLHCCR